MINRNPFRASLLGLLFVSLAAVPAMAQIPPGNDFWVTPNNGQTFFDFPAGDVESLCGAPATSGWNHRTVLKGVPIAADYDTVVNRIDNVAFDPQGYGQTRIVVKGLSFASVGPQSTPCGAIDWRVGLAGAQSITIMKLRRTSAQGGYFHADIAVNVEFKAYKAGSTSYLGSLFYNIVLPDPTNGTPWSFGPGGVFRAGMTPANNCIDVLREKLASTSPTSRHFYWISDMIAAGQCTRQTAP